MIIIYDVNDTLYSPKILPKILIARRAKVSWPPDHFINLSSRRLLRHEIVTDSVRDDRNL